LSVKINIDMPCNILYICPVFTRIRSKMKKTAFLLLVFLLCGTLFAQVIKQASVCRYEASQIVDPEKGIILYDGLNKSLGGKNVRFDEDNNLVQGWVEDYYENGKVMHRGYYLDGQLRNFKNFYDNGQVERKYKASNWRRSKMKTYFTTGKLRSKVAYYKSKQQKAEEFYANGNQKNVEEKNKFAQYYIMTKSFYEDGKVKSVFQLTDKDNLTYIKTEYHPNGTIKEQGNMKYDPDKNAYLKEGPWKRYDDAGKITAEVTFTGGKIEGDSHNW
jgi:antitoxin component YwqK of YwqJK toxin-antitoxin module